MNEPIIPIPAAHADPCGSNTTGEGAETALAAMLRQRRMGGNRVEPDLVEPPAPPRPAG